MSSRPDWIGESLNLTGFNSNSLPKNFDVNKLDKLTKESGIITEEIINICKL